jgi:phosphatidylglycerol lysyltransferase
MQISTHEHPPMELLLKSLQASSSVLSDRIPLSLHETACPSDSAWQAAVHLASGYGYNSLAFFALDQNKQLFFSSTGKAFISYVLQGGIVLVIGDPIGPSQELSLILEEFLTFWRTRHKAVAFWQAREELLNLYRAQGLQALKIGEDTIIDVQNFTLKGGKMANVRTSARRAEKSGMRVIFYEGTVPSVTYREQMAHISRAWLAHKGGNEMGFSMGRFESDAEAGQLIALAVDEHDTVHAFASFIPIYGRNGWSLDLLRRSEQAIPGTMELLLTRSLEHFKDRGNAIVSLGLAPQGNNNQDQVSLLGQCCSLFVRRSSTFQHFQTLTAFKRKFQPTWENRYLVFPHQIHLVQIGLALHAAHRQQN